MKSTGGFSTNKSWGKCWHATHEEWYSLSEWEVNLIYFPGWMCSNTFKKKTKVPLLLSLHPPHSGLSTWDSTWSCSQQLKNRACFNSSINRAFDLSREAHHIVHLKKHQGGLSTDQVELSFFHQKKLSLQQIVSQNRPWDFFWVVQSCEKVYPTPRNLFYQWM